jgi:XapX domain-containing protein
MRVVCGFILALAIGAVCRVARIPSPAPNAIVGALLVVSMSTGYVLSDIWLARTSTITANLSRPQIRSQQAEKVCKEPETKLERPSTSR